MRIGVVQIKSEKGSIDDNISNHLSWIDLAVAKQVDLIVFPELSLTGYEPGLANKLATDKNDLRLERFQKRSDQHDISICVGLPIRSTAGIFIGMVIFTPYQAVRTYSKQKLHADELPYFIPGHEQIILTIQGLKVAPAICYESLLPGHAEFASRLGAEIYVASVAKSQTGIARALEHFPEIASRYSMPVLMANCIGFCDDFHSAGQTAIWDKSGTLLAQLDEKTEGILIFDTETNDLQEI